MAISLLGEKCPSCQKKFGVLSVPVECEWCGTEVHTKCRTDSFDIDKVHKLDFSKIKLCRSCKKEEDSCFRSDPHAKALVKAYEKGYRAGYKDGHAEGESDQYYFGRDRRP